MTPHLHLIAELNVWLPRPGWSEELIRLETYATKRSGLTVTLVDKGSLPAVLLRLASAGGHRIPNHVIADGGIAIHHWDGQQEQWAENPEYRNWVASRVLMAAGGNEPVVSCGTAAEFLRAHFPEPCAVVVCGGSELNLELSRVADFHVLMGEGTLLVPTSRSTRHRIFRTKVTGSAGILAALLAVDWSRSESGTKVKQEGLP